MRPGCISVIHAPATVADPIQCTHHPTSCSLVFMPSVWKQLSQKHKKEIDKWVRDTGPLEQVDQVVRETHEHLRSTSLEHLTHAEYPTVDESSIVHPSYDGDRGLKELFVSQFAAWNESIALESGVPNWNELIFIGLCRAWYVRRGRLAHWGDEVNIRSEPIAALYGRLINNRFNTSKVLAYKHYHVIDRKHFVDRNERLERARRSKLDGKNKHLYDATTWAKMEAAEEDRKFQEMSKKTSAQEMIDAGKRQFKKYARRMELYGEEEAEVEELKEDPPHFEEHDVPTIVGVSIHLRLGDADGRDLVPGDVLVSQPNVVRRHYR